MPCLLGVRALLSSRSTGEEQVTTSGGKGVKVMAVRDSQLLCTDFVTKFLGSSLDANMQAVCSWLGGTRVHGSHAPHNDLNPNSSAQAGCWSSSHELGAFSDLGCCSLFPLLSSAPLKITLPSWGLVPLPSESPTELCSTTRCALYPCSKDSASAPRMEAAVCAACTLCNGHFTSPGHGLEDKVSWRGKDLKVKLEPCRRQRSLEQKELPLGSQGLL